MVNKAFQEGLGTAVQPDSDTKVKTPFGIFHFRLYSPAATPSTFAAFAPLVAVWQAKRRGSGLPQWRDFVMEDFVGWHRNLALSDFGADDVEPRFRIFGSGLSELMGADLTGKPLSEAVPNAAEDGILQHLARVRDQGKIGLVSGNVGMPGLEHRNLMVIELPLQNEAGKVAQLLHGIRPLDSSW